MCFVEPARKTSDTTELQQRLPRTTDSFYGTPRQRALVSNHRLTQHRYARRDSNPRQETCKVSTLGRCVTGTCFKGSCNANHLRSQTLSVLKILQKAFAIVSSIVKKMLRESSNQPQTRWSEAFTGSSAKVNSAPHLTSTLSLASSKINA